MLLHAANRKEGDGGEGPTTGEEEAQSQCHLEKGRGQGLGASLVWENVSLRSSHGPQLVDTFTASSEALGFLLS